MKKIATFLKHKVYKPYNVPALIFHEVSHALMALLTLKRVIAIKVNINGDSHCIVNSVSNNVVARFLFSFAGITLATTMLIYGILTGSLALYVALYLFSCITLYPSQADINIFMRKF